MMPRKKEEIVPIIIIDIWGAAVCLMLGFIILIVVVR